MRFFLLLTVLTVGLVTASSTVLAGVGTVDDRNTIFAVQAKRITNLGEEAEGLARCGIRSKHWSGEIQTRIIEGVVKLADRLWPNSMTDEAESDARGDALSEAYRALDEASERGRHVAPEWCANTGSRIAPVLDEFVSR